MSSQTLSSEQLKELKKSVLLDKLAYLCEELGDPGRYFPELRSKHVLDVTDTDVIKSKPTELEKTTEFVTIISKRSASNGQHGLDVLVEALRKQRVHAHVGRTLTRALNKKKAEAERTFARKFRGNMVAIVCTVPVDTHVYACVRKIKIRLSDFVWVNDEQAVL